MVLEIADIAVHPGTGEDFAAAVRTGIRYVADTPGFGNARLTRSIESPDRFVLMIEWDNIEAHTVGFRQSENLGRWREYIGPYLAGEPRVEHFHEVALPGPAAG
jgi:heme-degrading monooxygenase HmoA